MNEVDSLLARKIYSAIAETNDLNILQELSWKLVDMGVYGILSNAHYESLVNTLDQKIARLQAERLMEYLNE